LWRKLVLSKSKESTYIFILFYISHIIFFIIFFILYLSISFLWSDLLILLCSFVLYYIYLLFLNFDLKSESIIIRANFSGFRISLKPRNIMSNEIHNVHIITFFWVFCANYETTSFKNPGSQEVYSSHDNWLPRIKVLSQYFAAILFQIYFDHVKYYQFLKYSCSNLCCFGKVSVLFAMVFPMISYSQKN
jgi:hypothetical protein